MGENNEKIHIIFCKGNMATMNDFVEQLSEGLMDPVCDLIGIALDRNLVPLSESFTKMSDRFISCPGSRTVAAKGFSIIC